MSYHLEMEKTGKVPKIDMPSLVEETQQLQSTQQQEYEVHPEIAAEFVQPIQESIEQVEQVEAKPEAQVPETKKDNDLRALREKAKRAEVAERERDELLRKMYELESAKQKQPIKEEVYEKELSPDDLVDAKYLKRYDKTIQELRDELRSYKQQTNATTTETHLRNRYPDIDKVVSKENLDILKEEYPEIAETINTAPDFYNKAVAAYTLIKKFGISQEDTYMEDKLKAQKNAAKPRPLASVNPQQGESPLSKANAFANGLTDELKLQLRKEMEAARRLM